MVVYPEDKRQKKRVYSHIEIALMVERNAAKIRELGLKPREAVALIAPSGMELAVMFMTLQWAGAIGVPINPDLDPDFIKSVIVDTGCKIVISPLVDKDERAEDPLWNKVEGIAQAAGVISWHMFFTRNSGVEFDTHGIRADPHAAWHSGNKDLTLDPKEVAMRVVVPLKGKHLVLSLKQEDYCFAIKTFASTYNLKPSVMTVLSSPVYSLQGLLVMLSAMYSGGGIVIQAGGTFDSSKFWSVVKEDKVKWISLTAEQLVDLANETITEKVDVSGDLQLDFIRSCPGSLEKAKVEALVDVFRCPIIESYGPPESSGFATANTDFEFKNGTLGKPVPGVKVGVYDLATKKPKGVNERGHIAVFGENVVGTGYDNDPEETEFARFWDDAEHVGKIEEAWMFTGDEGMFDEDGFLTVYFQAERDLSAGALMAAVAAKEAEDRKNAEMAAAAAASAAAAATAAALAAEEAEKSAAAAEAAKKAEEEAAAAKEAEEVSSRSFAVEPEEEAEPKTEPEPKVEEARALPAASPMDMYFAATLLKRLEEIERRQVELAESMKAGSGVTAEDDEKLEELESQKKASESDARALRAATIAAASAPVVMEVNMEEVEAASMAAASSAEEAKNNAEIAADCAVEGAVYVSEASAAARAAADAAASAAIAAAAAAELAEQVTKKPLPVKETIVREVLPKPKADSSVVERTLLINLEDVDQAVKSHPAVNDAMAFGKLDERYGMDVYCAVIVRKGARVSEGWLRLHTQTVLPAAVIPKKFYLVDRLPTERAALSECENIPKEFCDEKKAERTVRGPAYKKGDATPTAGAAAPAPVAPAPAPKATAPAPAAAPVSSSAPPPPPMAAPAAAPVSSSAPPPPPPPM